MYKTTVYATIQASIYTCKLSFAIVFQIKIDPLNFSYHTQVMIIDATKINQAMQGGIWKGTGSPS